MQVIMPLCEHHYYHIDSDESWTEEQMIEIHSFIKKHSKKYDYKQSLEYIRSIGTSVVQLFIKFCSYSWWIGFFRYCTIMKYYWSDELIQKIIDQNENDTMLHLLNNDKIDQIQDDQTPSASNIMNASGLLINLTNQYDMNYNFTINIMTSRIQNLISFLDQMFDHININDYYGGSDILIWLGENKRNEKNVVITLYSKTFVSFQPKSGTCMCIKQDYRIFTKHHCTDDNQVTVRIYEKIMKRNYIFLIDHGIINFQDLCDVWVNARLYQYFNNNKNRLNQYVPILTDTDLCEKNTDKSYVQKIKNYQTLDQLIKHNFDKCYICKNFFNAPSGIKGYDSCCMECASISYFYKNEKADLKDLTIFITGIRTKIGFATALKVLRSGGNIIGTTRFPCFAIYNYSSEDDYEVWKHRLVIIKCDFTKIDSVYKMLNILEKYQINVLINNAFRTIRTSEYYFKKIREIEHELSQYLSIKMNQGNIISSKSKEIINLSFPKSMNNKKNHLISITDNVISKTDHFVMIEYEKNQFSDYNPSVYINQFKDIVDKVHDNSWDKSLDKLDPKEIVECMVINQIVPTLLINQMIAQLKEPKFLINVTSYEGQFNLQNKTVNHIHTNMCKAAMNMLIRSLINNKDNLHVYSIDPGYVSGICPQADSYPVHMDDAGSRLLFPIIRYFNDGKPLGPEMTKLRNYIPESW